MRRETLPFAPVMLWWRNLKHKNCVSWIICLIEMCLACLTVNWKQSSRFGEGEGRRYTCWWHVNTVRPPQFVSLRHVRQMEILTKCFLFHFGCPEKADSVKGTGAFHKKDLHRIRANRKEYMIRVCKYISHCNQWHRCLNDWQTEMAFDLKGPLLFIILKICLIQGFFFCLHLVWVKCSTQKIQRSKNIDVEKNNFDIC